MNRLWTDTETYSDVPINRGTYRYAEGVELMIVTYAMNDEKVLTWDRTADPTPPRELTQRIIHADTLDAHNAIFDRTMLNREAWFRALKVGTERWRCMMARAYRHGLPGGLEKLSQIFQLNDQAKIDGKLFINMFCKPKKDGSRETRLTQPMLWEGFLAYADQDIVAMRALDGKMPAWNETTREHHLYLIDQIRNDRGFAVDLPMAAGLLVATAAESKRFADRTTVITDGSVLKTTQRDKLLKWLCGEYGVLLPDLTADTIERRLEDPELPDMVKEILRIRLSASKSSSTKAKRIIEGHVGGRMRGTIQYGGAMRTLRDAGRIFQPQNLPRPDMDAVARYFGVAKVADLKKGQFAQYCADARAAFKGGYADVMFGPDLMQTAATMLRGLIIAPPGKKLLASDLSNIEGRYLAWMVGETWKVQAFRDYDTIVGTDEKGKPIRKGPDLYKLAYARAFAVNVATVKDDSDERQIGKVMELALGYGGGVGAFAVMAATYGIDLDDMAEKAWPSIPGHVLGYARKRWAAELEKAQKKLAGSTPFDMAEKTYLVCQSLVTMWRNAHPATAQFWHSLENAMRNAIVTPNTPFRVQGLTVDSRSNWLRIRLHSGRYLCYPGAKVSENGTVSYAGVDQYTRQWRRINTYGGKATENVDQAGSRDVFKDGEARAHADGFPVVLVVHDEVLAECDDTPEWTVERLSAHLTKNAEWNKGLPLAAAGKEMQFYGK